MNFTVHHEFCIRCKTDSKKCFYKDKSDSPNYCLFFIPKNGGKYELPPEMRADIPSLDQPIESLPKSLIVCPKCKRYDVIKTYGDRFYCNNCGNIFS